MNYHYDTWPYLQQLYQYIETQQKKIEQLEITIELLQNEFETLKQQAARQPDRIEYKFDQLKVERLEGTLNIGITPTGGIEPSSIEDFSINRNAINVPNSIENKPLLLENIKKHIYDYLNGDCYNVMNTLEQRYNYQLDPPYRNFIVEDVRNQIDKRIHYYLNEANITGSSENALKEVEETTINNVKNDINRTIEEFIKHLPQKGE